MRNLNSFSGNTTDFLDEVVASKRNSSKDPNYKQRINVLVPGIKVLFGIFDTVHDANEHISLSPYGYINQNKVDLLKLYSSKNARLIKLKNSITTILDNRALNICQYCTIAPIGSLDHIVPQGEFPEFSVNPKNLLPACPTCNSYKTRNWKENHRTLFLNFYTDILPEEQYLFVDLIVTPDNIEPTYRLSNINNIDLHFYQLVESHYTRLHLLKRFKKESHKIISELTNLISASRNLLNRMQITEIVITKIGEDKKIFGTNYYKSILEEALINNLDYMDSIIT